MPSKLFLPISFSTWEWRGEGRRCLSDLPMLLTSSVRMIVHRRRRRRRRLIGGFEARRESVVVEGVHLSLNLVVRLMETHSSVVPFLLHIRWGGCQTCFTSHAVGL